METFKNKFPKLFQRDILSCLVQDKKFLKEALGVLQPNYFEKKWYLLACESIYKIYLKTKELPSKSSLLHAITEKFEKDVRVKDQNQRETLILEPASALLKNIFKPLNGSQEYVKAETLRFCQVQELKRSFLEGVEELQKDSDPEKAKAFLSKKLRHLNILDQGGSDFFRSIEDLPQSLVRDRERCMKTGFPSLDKYMDGGMDPGTETVFMAPSKFGKSMILVNVGKANLVRGKTVIHFTLEISEKKIMKRYASLISGVARIERCPKRTIRKVKKFYQLHRGKLFVKGYPTKSATVETLKSYIYGLMNKHDIKPDLIIVDYGDLLRSYTYKDKNGDQERFVQGDVFEGLRAMAQEFDCTLVTASQTNRAAATKPIIRMEDIAESYAKCQIADHIIAICGTDEERKKKRLRLYFAGSREAQTHMIIPVKFNWKIAKMRELSKEERFEEDVQDGD